MLGRGYYAAGTAPFFHTLVEHWDGTQWSIIASPTPTAAADYDGVQLTAVACASPSECWAVGEHGSDYYTGGINYTLIEEWDGTQWSIVTSPNYPILSSPTRYYYGNTLSDVTCTSVSECWAVGQYWDGGRGQNVIQRWDGTQWSIVNSPNVMVGPNSSDNQLNGVTCTSDANCWAVGQGGNTEASYYGTLTEHWDGTSWSVVSSSNLNNGSFGNALNGIICLSASDCWAAGAWSAQTIGQWNGVWSLATAPSDPSSQLPTLSRIACGSESNCWIVGHYSGNGNPVHTLIETLTTSPVTITTSSSSTAGGTTSGGSTYVKDTTVTVSATAKTGYVFTNWKKSGTVVSTSPNYTFTATSNVSLVATFTPTYTISTSASPSGGGSTTGDGTYAKGANVTVMASPNPSYTFTNWTKSGVIVSHSTSYSFTATANTALVANFTTNPVILTTSVSPTGGGTTSGDGTYANGANVRVNAFAGAGYTFTYWTLNGTIVSHTASYAFKMTANTALVANFTTNPVTVTTSASPTTGGTTSGGGVYANGDSVTVKATAKTGYKFTNWTLNGGVVSTSASYRFTATSDTALVANFVQTYKITVSASPSTTYGTAMGGGTYVSGATVTVTATPTTGHTFVDWTENGIQVSASPSYSFLATANRTLVANFM